MYIRYSYRAARQFRALSTISQQRLAEKMIFFAAQNNLLRFARYISNEHMYRFRIGDYRIFFTIINEIIWVAKIERRDKAYE